MTVRHVEETGSTNIDMLEWAAHGAREHDWIFAARQTAGRGRRAREWVSPVGNLHGTGLVRLRDGDPPAPTLALVAAIVVFSAIQSFQDFETVKAEPKLANKLQIKWPNDILVDGAKIAGILLEREGNAVAIGVGVNVGYAPAIEGRATTCLAEIGIEIAGDPVAFLERQLESRLRSFLRRWRSDEEGGFPRIRSQWLASAHPIGTPLAVTQGGGSRVEGLFEGLDEGGALRLRGVDGEIRVIHAGDVFLL